MSKQHLYVELAAKLEKVNELLSDARAFADEHDLVMSHKDNGGEYYGDVKRLLKVRTLTERDVNFDNPEAVEDEERTFDYYWLPSSIRC